MYLSIIFYLILLIISVVWDIVIITPDINTILGVVMVFMVYLTNMLKLTRQRKFKQYYIHIIKHKHTIIDTINIQTTPGINHTTIFI